MPKPLYDKPVWQLMREMVSSMEISSGDVVTRGDVESWFAQHYPKVKPGTVAAHLIKMSTNARSRVHYSARRGDDDLFFQLDGGTFRLYRPESDPPPIYSGQPPTPPPLDPDGDAAEGSAFAYESDLRDYLSRNLNLLEPGLRLYEDEGVSGIEYPAGGRFVDILAVDTEDNLVVIELKVSRGYDRVIGQVLRYMAWLQTNLAEPPQQVRGMIVAREISDDLRLACQLLPGVCMFEYSLSVSLRKVGA